MLLPREFLEQYGQCVTRIVQASQLSPFIIPENADRYLLCFWQTNNTCHFHPKVDNPAIFTQDFFSATSLPYFITHALYGALVNLEWQIRVNAIGVTANVILIEGRMPPEKKPRRKGK